MLRLMGRPGIWRLGFNFLGHYAGLTYIQDKPLLEDLLEEMGKKRRWA